MSVAALSGPGRLARFAEPGISASPQRSGFGPRGALGACRVRRRKGPGERNEVNEKGLNKKMSDTAWNQVREALERSLGKDDFRNWIRPLKFVGLQDGLLIFHAPTHFLCDWVETNYADKIVRHFAEAGVEARGGRFIVPETAKKPRGESGGETPKQKPKRKSRGKKISLPGAPLDQRFTFDGFVVGKPNELAYTAARRVASGGQAAFNPLFLYGGVGLGKTHLMHAIAHELIECAPNLRVVYLSAEQFMYRFVQAIRENKTMDFKRIFRSVDVLMVDDLQFVAGKESTQEEFFHTFNALIDESKQIVISGDRAPGEIEDLEERIKSRMQCGLVVDLHPTDYELRLGILQTKFVAYRSQFDEMVIANGVLECLASRISNNVRVLEGALMRLLAFASLLNTREITMDITLECLADVFRASDRKVTIEEIQRKVCEHYNIRLSDLIGPNRSREVARPRQVAMWLAKQLTTKSLPDIGRSFGGRDHTTVLHGIRRIDELRAGDSQMAENLEIVRRRLEA